MSQKRRSQTVSVNRRQWIGSVTAAAGALALNPSARAEEPVAKNQRIRQSLVQWCYAPYWSLDQMCQIAKRLGCLSIELAPPEDWATLKKHGLTCAISPSHLFVQGMNNPRYQAGCLELLRKRIDQAADAGVPTVITFTGYAEESGEWAGGDNPDLDKLPGNRRVIDPDEGIKNCVTGFKKIVGYAEQKKINLSMEILNTRADDHPMKGHPGYQGDHVDYCMEIIRQVGSPRFGILFDIYHVQIMDGDIIRRIHQCGEAINHVHTAGNPGRGELDENQEINYPPCMKALLEIGYQGYVGQEFIPTRDPLEGLTQAVRLCDV
jgi:hydroxypyruvate isomerase